MARDRRPSQSASDRGGFLFWPLNAIVLGIIGIPAFTGYPLGYWPTEVVAGVDVSRVCYWVVVMATTYGLLGPRMFANILAVTAMVTLPVVFAGGTISWVAIVLGISGESLDAAGMHYLRLCLTMLTVVPLALTLVALVPFGRIEQRLLLDPRGVGAHQKKMLMALRVFNHIAFGVLPGMLEILREERFFDVKAGTDPFGRRRFWIRVGGRLVYLGVGAICASLQYIPLWAYEIGQLPEKKDRK